MNPQILFAPMIPAISLFLLLFMEPPLAYLSLQAMINRNRKKGWYLATGHERFTASVFAIRDLAMKNCKKVIGHAEQLDVSISKLFFDCIPSFFLPKVTLPVALTIFDSFVTEGRKILARICCGLLFEAKDRLLDTKTKEGFDNVVGSQIENLQSVAVLQKVIQSSFKLSISRERHVERAESKFMNLQIRTAQFLGGVENGYMSGLPTTQRGTVIPHIRPETATFYPAHLVRPLIRNQTFGSVGDARTPGPEVIGGKLLDQILFRRLNPWFPIETRRYSAKLVYRMSVNGTSFVSFLEAGMVPGYYLLLVQTNKQTIGAFIPDALQPSRKGYYGRASIFVFQCDDFAVYPAKAGSNERFLSVEDRDLMIGGPNPAIYLQDQFLRLGSGLCETFDSPSLTVGEDGDQILEVELYKLTLSI
jgi:hypothetical protein